MDKADLTVWCITYNQANYIKKTLEGFLMQETTFRYQVVVHDDASTDGTTDIIREYAEKHPDIITPWIESENQWKKGGLPHIINLMNTKYRQTKYIALCEGDDYWTDPYKLQKQIDFLEANPKYSMCFHSAIKKYECSAISWIDCENIQDRDYSATEIFVNWTIPTASVVCRKEGLDFYANLEDADKIQNYDIFIFLSCAMVGKLRGIHEQMSVYRVQKEGLTYNDKALTQTIRNNPEHFRSLKKNFPIVESKYVDDTISKTYFERGIIQDKFIKKLEDFYYSFHFSTFQFFKMVGIRIYHKIKSAYGKL